MKTVKGVDRLSFPRMALLDAEDTQVARGIFGAVVVFVSALAVVAIAGAGVIGLAFRVFQLTAG
jgi:hypothetical protein